MVTSRETAGLPEARVFQVGVTVTRAEQEGEEEVEEEGAEVEDDVDDDDDDGDGGASPLLRFHDANLLPARVRPPPGEACLSPPEMRPGMSSVKGPGSEGAERSGDEAREEDKVFFDAAAAALDAADARATPATASSSSTRAAAAAPPPPARNDVEPFEPRLRAAERAMVGREEGRKWGKKDKRKKEKPKTDSFSLALRSPSEQKHTKNPPTGEGNGPLDPSRGCREEEKARKRGRKRVTPRSSFFLRAEEIQKK